MTVTAEAPVKSVEAVNLQEVQEEAKGKGKQAKKGKSRSKSKPQTQEPVSTETAVPEAAVPEATVPETAVPETAVPEAAVPETSSHEEAPTQQQSRSKRKKADQKQIALKIICSSDVLGQALAIACRAIAGRPSHPVLANVLVQADVESQSVKLTGFDLSLGIEATFSAQVEAGGKICLPAKLLNDLVSKLPSGEVTLWCSSKKSEGDETLGEKLSCGLEYASGKVSFSGISPEEFPSLPKVDGRAIYLPSETLLEGLRGTLFATSTDETKQVLTGVHVTLERDEVEFASTDGHRLAVVKATTSSAVEDEYTESSGSHEEPTEVTIPGKALYLVEHLLKSLPTSSRRIEQSEGEEEHQSSVVEVRFEPGQLIFRMDNYQINTRTLEGQYPDIHQLIPKQFLREVTVERRSFLSAMERIAILADSKNNVVKFSIDPTEQMITASVEAANVGSGKEAIPVDISGESLDIAFNIKYVIDALKSLSSSDAILHINRNNTPAIFTPIGGETQKLVLLMPVQIRD